MGASGVGVGASGVGVGASGSGGSQWAPENPGTHMHVPSAGLQKPRPASSPQFTLSVAEVLHLAVVAGVAVVAAALAERAGATVAAVDVRARVRDEGFHGGLAGCLHRAVVREERQRLHLSVRPPASRIASHALASSRRT